MKEKLFAVIRDGIVVDGWLAKTLEEAQQDNPDATLVEVTLKNSPFALGQVYKENING